MLLENRQLRLVTIEDKILSIFMEKKELKVERLIFIFYNKFNRIFSHQHMTNYMTAMVKKGYLEKTGIRTYKLIGG